jgi:hypothetical protein
VNCKYQQQLCERTARLSNGDIYLFRYALWRGDLISIE